MRARRSGQHVASDAPAMPCVVCGGQRVGVRRGHQVTCGAEACKRENRRRQNLRASRIAREDGASWRRKIRRVVEDAGELRLLEERRAIITAVALGRARGQTTDDAMYAAARSTGCTVAVVVSVMRSRPTYTPQPASARIVTVAA